MIGWAGSRSLFRSCSDGVTRRALDLVGFRAVGRYGELGVVVESQQSLTRGAGIVVRGGVSSALLFLVPEARVHSIEPARRLVRLDVDLADFTPSLLGDGTVELRVGTE